MAGPYHADPLVMERLDAHPGCARIARVTDLARGFQKIAWTDDQAAVRKKYRRAIVVKPFTAHNPRTGEPTVVPGYLKITRVVRSAVPMVCRVVFGASGVQEISLCPPRPDDLHDLSAADRRHWDQLALERLSALGAALGFGPVSARREPQLWQVGAVTVGLDWGEGFRLSFSRAASDGAARRARRRPG
jgi:hypothetical protein